MEIWETSMNSSTIAELAENGYVCFEKLYLMNRNEIMELNELSIDTRLEVCKYIDNVKDNLDDLDDYFNHFGILYIDFSENLKQKLISQRIFYLGQLTERDTDELYEIYHLEAEELVQVIVELSRFNMELRNKKGAVPLEIRRLPSMFQKTAILKKPFWKYHLFAEICLYTCDTNLIQWTVSESLKNEMKSESGNISYVAMNVPDILELISKVLNTNDEVVEDLKDIMGVRIYDAFGTTDDQASPYKIYQCACSIYKDAEKICVLKFILDNLKYPKVATKVVKELNNYVDAVLNAFYVLNRSIQDAEIAISHADDIPDDEDVKIKYVLECEWHDSKLVEAMNEYADLMLVK